MEILIPNLETFENVFSSLFLNQFLLFLNCDVIPILMNMRRKYPRFKKNILQIWLPCSSHDKYKNEACPFDQANSLYIRAFADDACVVQFFICRVMTFQADPPAN